MTQLILGQLLNGIIVGSLYGIIALGVTLTFGLTGIVNFALGAFMMLGAYSTWYLYDVNHLPYPVAVIGAVLIVSIIGYLSDLMLFRFTRGNLVNGLLVSIGLISVFEALILAAFTTTPKDLTYVLPGAFQVAGMFLPKIKVVVCLVFLAIIFGTYLALTRTWLGRAAFAYAQNPEAAALMGIRTERLQTIVVVYSTALAGLGGGLYASMYSLEPTIGAAYILKAVEAAILAGVGSVIGALGGGIILGVSENIGSVFFPSAFRDAYGLVFLIAILLVRPSGLFGDKS
ncbi:branched-chain amino acid ABC transporter permease [Bradyrhizobium sp. G127]|jgi:branched-chain amino acid transport system permease protein|uniref:branched-chain amino acid ABC transporter permease n=1 Tax=Bradyrhizobium sp. G127 TaxID=2904800 RepID=UPI001F2A0918|nr:branched-chain amino acid ABC transporter permease [Bradyrhizobium sp. G127]MCF2524731.1 branched-chain amino acid ABC transporter permease [Bradyrhizobium sp. G127]